MDIISRTLAETDGLNYAKVESILFRNLCILTKADISAFILFDQSNLHLKLKKTLPQFPANGKSGFHISNQIFQSLQGQSIQKWSSKFDFYHELLPEKISSRIKKSPTNWLHLSFTFGGSSIAFALVHIVEKIDTSTLRSFLPVTALILQRSFAFSNLKKTRLELNTVYGTSTDIIILIDKELNIIWSNRLGQYFFGNKVVGHKIYTTLHDGTPQKDDRILRSLFESGGSKDFERSILSNEGKIKNYSCVANIAGEDGKGKPQIAVIFFRDITSQKRQKNNLLLLNDKVNRCQKSIIRSRSHNILGKLYSELYEDLEGGMKETQQKFEKLLDFTRGLNRESFPEYKEWMELLNQFQGSYEESTGLENSFRNLVFIRQIRRELASYDLNRSVKELLGLIKPIRQKEIKLVTDYGEIPEIQVMSVEINAAVYELLNNATEALILPNKTPEATIEIKTWADEEWVHLNIQDNGPGLDKGNFLSAFDFFYSNKHHVTGIGIGMSVVQEYIVSRHNGNLSLDSSREEGGSFTISLPLKVRGSF